MSKLINIPINRPTLTINKAETDTTIIITITVTNRPTSITKEILIIIPIDNPTITPTQELTIAVHED